jgi:hypothetical protein
MSLFMLHLNAGLQRVAARAFPPKPGEVDAPDARARSVSTDWSAMVTED